MAESAKGIIDSFLAAFGLQGLGDWAWNMYVNGSSIDEIMLELRNQPAYKARFPAMDYLAQQGNAISEQEYIQYEKTVRQMLQNWGVPSGMYDTPDGIANLLMNNVSSSEVSQRLRIAASAAYTAPKEVRDSLQEMYNITGGDLVGYWLDPDKAQPLIEQQYRAAEVGGAAKQQQLKIERAEAERLASLGITYEQAVQGFGQVAATTGLGGGAGETADQSTRTAAAFGDAAAAQKVERVTKSRQAAFSGGGGAAETQAGVTGLGGAST